MRVDDVPKKEIIIHLQIVRSLIRITHGCRSRLSLSLFSLTPNHGVRCVRRVEERRDSLAGKSITTSSRESRNELHELSAIFARSQQISPTSVPCPRSRLPIRESKAPDIVPLSSDRRRSSLSALLRSRASSGRATRSERFWANSTPLPHHRERYSRRVKFYATFAPTCPP